MPDYPTARRWMEPPLTWITGSLCLQRTLKWLHFNAMREHNISIHRYMALADADHILRSCIERIQKENYQ